MHISRLVLLTVMLCFTCGIQVVAAQDLEDVMDDATQEILDQLDQNGELAGAKIAVMGFRDGGKRATERKCFPFAQHLAAIVTDELVRRRGIYKNHAVYSVMARSDLDAIESSFLISSGGGSEQYEGVIENLLGKADILITGDWRDQQGRAKLNVRAISIGQRESAGAKSVSSKLKDAYKSWRDDSSKQVKAAAGGGSRVLASSRISVAKAEISKDVSGCFVEEHDEVTVLNVPKPLSEKKGDAQEAQPNESSEKASVQAQPKQGDLFTESSTGVQLLYIPKGCFQMGDTLGDGVDHEKPSHKVCVDGFYIGKYEVSQGEYQQVMGVNPSAFKKGSNFPVEHVSWNDTQLFIEKLNQQTGHVFRLPTEAEWEYAASSSGKKHKYSGGADLEDVAWFKGNSAGKTHSRGGNGANGLGLYDMSGNVWEWCHDRYSSDYYGVSPDSNPQGPTVGEKHVFRGCSFGCSAWLSRIVVRRHADSNFSGKSIGFRLVLTSPDQ